MSAIAVSDIVAGEGENVRKKSKGKGKEKGNVTEVVEDVEGEGEVKKEKKEKKGKKEKKEKKERPEKEEKEKEKKEKKKKEKKREKEQESTNKDEDVEMESSSKIHEDSKTTEVPEEVKVEGKSEKKEKKKEKKKSKKKDEEKDAMEVDSPVVMEDESTNTKEKDKKRKRTREVEQEVEQEQQHSSIQPEAVIDIDAAPKLRKKPRKEKKDTEGADQVEGEKDIKKKQKKSKPAPKLVKSKKSHPNTTGFPDPDKDESLPAQSQKALTYAFSQFYDPEDWKFNKARQNWIVRNFWSSEMIPEKYEGLVTKYLSAVQGNTRESLIKACRTAIEEVNRPEKQAPEKPKEDAKTATGGPLIDTPITKPKQDEKSKPQRAQLLLKVLVPLTEGEASDLNPDSDSDSE